MKTKPKGVQRRTGKRKVGRPKLDPKLAVCRQKDSAVIVINGQAYLPVRSLPWATHPPVHPLFLAWGLAHLRPSNQTLLEAFGEVSEERRRESEACRLELEDNGDERWRCTIQHLSKWRLTARSLMPLTPTDCDGLLIEMSDRYTELKDALPTQELVFELTKCIPADWFVCVPELAKAMADEWGAERVTFYVQLNEPDKGSPLFNGDDQTLDSALAADSQVEPLRREGEGQLNLTPSLSREQERMIYEGVALKRSSAPVPAKTTDKSLTKKDFERIDAARNRKPPRSWPDLATEYGNKPEALRKWYEREKKKKEAERERKANYGT